MVGGRGKIFSTPVSRHSTTLELPNYLLNRPADGPAGAAVGFLSIPGRVP
jgi:hypothetical protein